MRQPWSAAEVALLRSMYPECHSEDVAAWLGRRVKQVYMAAVAHGVRKSDAYLASDCAARIQRGKQHPKMIATRIQPGAVPWNKGVKGSTGVQAGCRATQFKPGRKPHEAHNYQPIGSIRISRDGYAERKVTDDQKIAPARRWVPIHRLVWESARGPVPAGFLVRFKPGQRTADARHITIDRLECVCRAEHMARNSYHNYPPEIARLIQLRGALNRQINKHATE